MKHPVFVVFLLVVTAVLTFSIQMCAKSHKVPSGKLVSYHFSRGGGMNPMDYTVFHLRHDDETGKALLTISGDCEGEEITVEVGDEVFEHCRDLILQHKMYRSKGYYDYKYELLDAPSSSFSILFENYDDIISGGGDMPDFLWEGMSDIHKYFKSVVGDRKAEGHVDRIYGAEGVTGMHWTDGIHTYTTSKESLTELKRAVRGLSGDADTEPDGMGFTRFHDGDQHFVMIHDYQLRQERLFYSFDGKEATRKQMVKQQLAALRSEVSAEGKKIWPVVNKRFLSQPMMDALSLEQLEEMLNSIRVRQDSPYNSMPWYTDIGGVNRDLLTSEINKRKKDKD